MSTLLAVFAHPDDEFSVGPLLARCARLGHAVYLASITSGQKGSSPGAAGIPPGDELGAVRDEELRCAARALGIREPILMGYQDQGILSAEVMTEIGGRVRELIAELRPDVLITFGPDGITGHPDHRAASNIVTEVFLEQERLTYKPARLYYTVLPESLLARIPPPFDARLRTTADRFVTTVVDCREDLDRAGAAIGCHHTQWVPERMAHFDAINREVLGGRMYLRNACGCGAQLETDVV